MTTKRALLPVIFIPALFMLAALTLFIPYITRSLSFITFTSLSGLSAFKYQMGRSFLTGEYPLWNPYTICGSLFHTGIGVLDPFLIPQFFFKGSLALVSSSYFALVCAGYFMYLYLKGSWNMSLSASILGGVLYLANPFFAAASNESPFMNPPVYLPLVLLFSDISFFKKSYYYSCLAGIALAMTFLSGNIESYCYIAMVFFVLQVARVDTLAAFKFLLVSLFTSILFMSIDLFPTIEACLASARRDSYILLQTALFIALSGILAFISASIFHRATSVSGKQKGGVFAKASAIALLSLLFTLNFNKERSFWFITGIFRQKSIYSFQDPAYLFTILTLTIFLCLLWSNRKPIINFYLFFAVFLALPSYTLFPDLFKYFLHMNTIQFPRVMFAFFLIASLAVPYYVDSLKAASSGRRVMRIILTIILISESIVAWNIYTYQKNDIKILENNGREVRFMMERMNRDYRIGVRHSESDGERDGKDPGFDLSWNISLFWGVKNIEKSAMNFTRPRFDRLWESVNGNTSVTPTLLAGLDTIVYDLMGMRYLFSRERINNPRYSLLLKGDEYFIYENRKALPRLYGVDSIITASASSALNHIMRGDFDPEITAYVEDLSGNPGRDLSRGSDIFFRTTKDGYNVTRFEVESTSKAFIITTDAFDKNWKAYIDGVKQKLYKCNYYFRGFVMEKGRHVVEFRYEPASFFIGLLITLVTAIFIALLYFSERYKREIGRP